MNTGARFAFHQIDAKSLKRIRSAKNGAGNGKIDRKNIVKGFEISKGQFDRQLLEQHKANETSQRLAAIPGIGPITAITMALSVNPASFESGSHFAAWLGLTPKEHSTGC